MSKTPLQKDYDYATLILRTTLGLFFVIAGLAQLLNWAGLVDTVSGYAIVPAGSGIMSIVLPWIELVLGTMLVFGLATSVVSAIIALFSFAIAAVSGLTSGASLSKEILFISVALSLVLFGGGNISLDGRIKKSK